ncbi:tetratricopeptide repeat protein [Planifilum fimeticola]|uniref:tetratricopeptide repeat protein n=1 Tax=Planifilum fimeticola TaxID=201975 RepID=UPI0014766CEA|nr:tetratricopeptide repeat protein [Planifilum fimeticola]
MSDQMKMKQSGEWIGYTYRVLDAFPFVQGILYYSAVEGGDWEPGQGESQPTRFILAVGKRKREESARHLLKRDDAAFFPVEEEFVDEGVLYWVFRPLAGNLLAHRLIQAGSLPLGEVRSLLSAIFGHARRLASKGEYAVVDPLNILETTDGNVRFLYGGAAGSLPGAEIPDVEKQWVFGIASLAYRLLTGHMPPEGAALPPLRRHRGDIPAVWDGLIRKALSSDPSARPTLARLEAGMLKAPEERGDVPEEQMPAPAKPAEEGVRRAERGSSLPAAEKGADGRLPAVQPTPVKPSPIGADGSPRRGDGRRGANAGPGTDLVPQGKRSPYLVSEESPTSAGRSRNSQPLWKSKGLVAALVVCIVALAGLGGYQWLFADKDPADAKPSAVFDPEVEEDPEQAAVWHRQSVEAKNNKQVAQAILLGRKAVSADPNKRDYYVHLAELYQEAGDAQSAVLLLQEGVKRFPDDAELHDMLALYAYQVKDLKTAETASDRSVQLEPENPEYLYHRGKIFVAQGNQRTAAELIEEAVKRDSKNAVYHHDLAVILFRLEEIDRSIQYAEKAVQLSDSNEKYRMTLGLAYLKKRELLEKDSDLSAKEKKEKQRSLAKKAYESFQAATKLNDRYSQAYYYEAMSRFYYGDLSNAKRAVERAIVLNSDRASYHYQLGVILTAQNKKSEAIKALEKAVELEPNNDRYKKALTKLKSE